MKRKKDSRMWNIRLTKEDYELFSEQAEKMGQDLPGYFRWLLRQKLQAVAAVPKR